MSQCSHITHHTLSLNHGGMAFTDGVVVVAVAVTVLLVTLNSPSVNAATSDSDPMTRTEIMLLKPTAEPMNITVLTKDKFGERGFNVTLQEECFKSDLTWYFTQVNVSKMQGEFHLNLIVDACKISCINDKKSEETGGLKNIRVMPFGLENYIKTPGKMEDLTQYQDIINCNNIPIVNDDPLSFCPCAWSTSKNATHGSLSQLGIILTGGLVVQVFGTAVMAVVVIVVIRAGSR